MPVAFVRAPCGESGNSVLRLLEVDPRRCFSDRNGKRPVCAVRCDLLPADPFFFLKFSRLLSAHFRMLLLGIYDVGLLDTSSPYSTTFLIHLFNPPVGSHSFWNGSDYPRNTVASLTPVSESRSAHSGLGFLVQIGFDGVQRTRIRDHS